MRRRFKRDRVALASIFFLVMLVIVVYPGAGHGFHADYRPSYNKAAADDAWNRCLGWFNKNLKA